MISALLEILVTVLALLFYSGHALYGYLVYHLAENADKTEVCLSLTKREYSIAYMSQIMGLILSILLPVIIIMKRFRFLTKTKVMFGVIILVLLLSLSGFITSLIYMKKIEESEDGEYCGEKSEFTSSGLGFLRFSYWFNMVLMGINVMITIVLL